MDELFQAIRSADVSAIKLIIEKNPSLVNQKDARGFTPLIMSTYMGSPETASVLIEAGADINGRDAAGNTALMGVGFKGSVEMAKLLLDSGADVHLKNYAGSSAVDFANNAGHTELAALLKAHALK